MNRLINYILLSILLSTAIFANTDLLEKVSLQLVWKHQFEFAGYYMAKEKGFYKDAGLDLEIKEFTYGLDVSDEVSKGASTFGVSYSSLILDKAKGREIVLLSAIFQESPHILLSLKSSGIKSIKDFKNRKIMIDTNAYKSAQFISLFKSQDISLDDMNLIKHTFDINDLINSKTDLMSAFRSNEPYTLEKKHIEYDIWDSKDYGFSFYDGVLFTSSFEVNNNSSKVEAFRDASLKGWEYAFAHIDEAVALILKKYNTQNKTEEAFHYEASVLKSLAYMDEIELGNIDKSKLERTHDIYNLLNFTNIAVDVDSFIFKATDETAILSNYETKYLKKKKVITMCIDPSWMPFESFKDGEHIGMSADYFKIIKERLGIPIDVIQTQTWSQSLALAKTRKCDIMSLVMQTPERKEYLNFTEPYLKVPLVIATKIEVPFIHDIGSLEDEEIGIPKGYAFGELLKINYPHLNIVEVENTKDGLQKVSDGKLFGYIGTLSTVGYMFQTKFTGELKITGKFDETWNLGVGVRNDDTVLLEIFNKVIKSIDTKKRQEILNNWIAIKYEKGVDYSLTWQILAVLFLVIVIAMYRNSILKQSNINLQMAKKRADEKTVEAQLQKENFQQMLNTTMESIGIYEDGKCIDVNTSAIEFFALESKEQILGTSALDLVAPSSRELVTKHITEGYSEPYEIIAMRRDGTEFPALVRGRTYSVNGKTRRLVSVLDLTLFKNTEKELIKAKELAEEATKVKANFLANMSHEIRTPMNGILGMLHILSKTSLDAKQLEYVLKIKTASNNLLYMINDVLDFSKIEAGKLKIHMVDFDMRTVIQNVKDLVELKAKEKGLKFKVHFSQEQSVYFADELRISQVLLNLINNAIKFTHHGEVTLTIEQINKEDSLRFSVKDTGIGITQEQQNMLFESFNQADSTITRKYGGSGLGLSISKELIELMDGKIWLVSEPDKGSEFIFEIKLSQGDSQNLNYIDSHKEENTQLYSTKESTKEDISLEKKDELFSELYKAVKTSRPSFCQDVIQKMQKYNFTDKDARIFNQVQFLMKKYRFKEILEILDEHNGK